MKTSLLDTDSNEYLNMDFYNIYRQNPRLLRPEGGRHEEKRHRGHHYHYHQPDDVIMRNAKDDESAFSSTKGRFKGRTEGSGLSRKQPMP